MAKAVNDCGNSVEEFEIQFIDGEDIDCELAKAIGLNQGSFVLFLNCVDDWEDWEKTNAIIAVGECGYSFSPDTDTGPGDFDLNIYPVESLRELAEQFVDDGLFGELPENFQHYIDYDAIARDLGMEYTETTIAGTSIVYARR